MQGDEFIQRNGQTAAEGAVKRGDPDHALAVLRQALGLVAEACCGGFQRLGLGHEIPCFGGRLKALRVPLEQGEAKNMFQGLDSAGDGGLGDVEAFRGGKG